MGKRPVVKIIIPQNRSGDQLRIQPFIFDKIQKKVYNNSKFITIAYTGWLVEIIKVANSTRTTQHIPKGEKTMKKMAYLIALMCFGMLFVVEGNSSNEDRLVKSISAPHDEMTFITISPDNNNILYLCDDGAIIMKKDPPGKAEYIWNLSYVGLLYSNFVSNNSVLAAHLASHNNPASILVGAVNNTSYKLVQRPDMRILPYEDMQHITSYQNHAAVINSQNEVEILAIDVHATTTSSTFTTLQRFNLGEDFGDISLLEFISADTIAIGNENQVVVLNTTNGSVQTLPGAPLLGASSNGTVVGITPYEDSIHTTAQEDVSTVPATAHVRNMATGNEYGIALRIPENTSTISISDDGRFVLLFGKGIFQLISLENGGPLFTMPDLGDLYVPVATLSPQYDYLTMGIIMYRGLWKVNTYDISDLTAQTLPTATPTPTATVPTATPTPTATATPTMTPIAIGNSSSTPTPTVTPTPALPRPTTPPMTETEDVYHNEFAPGTLASNNILEVPGTFSGAFAPATAAITQVVVESLVPFSGPDSYGLKLEAFDGEASIYLFAFDSPISVDSAEHNVQLSISAIGNGIGSVDIGIIDYESEKGGIQNSMVIQNKAIANGPTTLSALRQPDCGKVVAFVQIVGAEADGTPAQIWLDSIVLTAQAKPD